MNIDIDKINEFRRLIYFIICELLKEGNDFNIVLKKLSEEYNLKVKTIKKLLKNTKFDTNIICIVKTKSGLEFLNSCNYLYILYKVINKMIYENFFKYKGEIPLIIIIKNVGEFLKEYDSNAVKIVFNTIKIELRKSKSLYKNFYHQYLDKKILKMFKNLELSDFIKKFK